MCCAVQEQYGADLSVDVSYEWLTFFLESDERLAEIARAYGSGAMLTGEVKKELIATLTVRSDVNSGFIPLIIPLQRS